MIKIERTSFEQIFRHLKDVELSEIKENIIKTKEEFAEMDRGKKIILYATVVILAIVTVMVVEYKASRSISPSSNIDEMFSNSRSGMRSADKQDDSRNSFTLDFVLGDLKEWSLFAGMVDTGALQGSRIIKVPQDTDSIQQAIDMAKSGDTVLVSAGEYKGNIVMRDGVSLVGENAQTVVLDGENKGNVIAFKGIANKDTRLENFTIKNSGDNLSGILIEDSSPLINRNIILKNAYNVYIKGESSPWVQRNLLSESKAGVQIFNLNDPKNAFPVISDNFIFENKKGINIYKGSAVIDHNTVSFNSLTGESGATFGIYLASASANIKNNIITDNGICELCSGIYADEGSHDVKINYNDLWNSQSNFVCFGKCEMGTDNFSDDPRFTNGVQYDFSLGADSPFLSAGADGQKLGARL